MLKIFVFILCFIPFFAIAQVNLIKEPFESVTTDHLGNVYLIHQNKISKYNASGTFQFSYNHSNMGTITRLDATDPFKILLYDQEYNQLLFLNNQLAPISDPVLLDQLDITVSEIACKSAKEGYWIFDGITRELKYFNSINQLIHKSNKIDQIIAYQDPPNFLTEKNNRVFINFPETGIIVFDSFGSYIKKILIKDLQSFQVKGEHLFYIKSNQLHQYNYIVHAEKILDLSFPEQAKNVLLENQFVYIISDKKIEIRKIKD